MTSMQPGRLDPAPDQRRAWPSSALREPPRSGGSPIEGCVVAAYRIPTSEPEADGTRRWDATTMLAVHIEAGGHRGFGYSYCHAAFGRIVLDTLAPAINGIDAFDLPTARARMLAALREIGTSGAGAMALSAVDTALWDLKARLLECSLLELWGGARDAVPTYASGGFTNYSDDHLADQLAVWAAQGFAAVKIKIGSEPARDPERVGVARDAIGSQIRLMVDANGALSRKQALQLAERLSHYDVRWFEEPVSSDDLDGLRLLRDRAPAPIEIAAGEYGWEAHDFTRLLQHGAVDVLQADGSRCGGYSGLFEADTLSRVHGVPLSLHGVPALHAACAAALPNLRDVEYFHDHARIEAMLLDGLPSLHDGCLWPERGEPGHGLMLRERDAERWRI